MNVFTNTEAWQILAKLLVIAQTEEVEIRRRTGLFFFAALEAAGSSVSIRCSGREK